MERILKIVFIMLVCIIYLRPANTNAENENIIPSKMREAVIFYDERYDSNWVEETEKVVNFFVERGFQQLNAEEIGRWMAEKVEKKNAYGTVCIFPSGVLPTSVLGEESTKAVIMKFGDKRYYENALIRQYMKAGGRVVWMGDITFYCCEGPTGGILHFPGQGAYLLADISTDQRIYYGAPSGQAVLTEEGKKWGLSKAYPPIRPVNRSDVTISFSEAPEDKASQIFLKTLNNQYPMSGLISFPLYIPGDKDKELLEDVYRLSLYLGEIVKVPEVPEKKLALPDVELKIKVGTEVARNSFIRGETVPIQVNVVNRIKPFSGTLILEFSDGKMTLLNRNLPVGVPKGDVPLASWKIETDKFAVGDYEVKAKLETDSGLLVVASEPVFLRRISKNPFFYAVWASPPSNPYRRKLFFEDLKEHNFELVSSPQYADEALRYGMRFTQRIEGPEGFPTAVSPESEFAIRTPDGKPHSNPWQPALASAGLSHPRILKGRFHGTAMQIRELKNFPNLYPYILTNDDFSVFYQPDWSKYTTELFKDATGKEAPRPDPNRSYAVLPKKGIVPENDPWFQWKLFTVRDVCGAYNQVIKEAKDTVLPEGRIGPVPGGMQLPLWTEAQYPPYQFGKEGFDLLSYYYYLVYWQPLIGNLYWDEIARMNNRDLPLWVTLDCSYGGNEPSYYRNTFFLHLAGCVNGLNYFEYSERSPEGWKELGRLGVIVKQLGPMLSYLKPAKKSIGLFLPLAHQACEWIYPTIALYPFANLMAAHIDIEPVCREEIINGRAFNYKAILLWNADWISEKAAKSLQDYINHGGQVILDASSEIEIPGAKRLSFDLAMGNRDSLLNTKDARFGTPGITDYQHPDRITLVKDAISKLVEQPYDSPSSELIIRSFTGEDVTYLWLINVHTREEYEYLRARLGAGVKVADPIKALEEVKEFLKNRGVYDKPFETTVVLPEGNYIVCDILKKKQLRTIPIGNGRVKCEVSMERLGGTLLALYPAKVDHIMLTPYPCEVKRGEKSIIEIRVYDTEKRLFKGVLPAEVKVLFPDGKEAPYSEFIAIRNGRYIFEIQPAVNEPIGEWSLKITDLAFNISEQIKLNVK